MEGEVVVANGIDVKKMGEGNSGRVVEGGGVVEEAGAVGWVGRVGLGLGVAPSRVFIYTSIQFCYNFERNT